MRVAASYKNILYGFLFQFVNLIMTLLLRTVFIKYFGIELLGVQNLFLNLMGLISIVELGLTTALAVTLYKPIKQNENLKLASLYISFKKLFSIIGLIIFFVSIITSLLIPYLNINTDININYIQSTFVLYSLSIVVGYFFSVNRIFYFAFQKNSIVLKNDSIFIIMKQFTQIIFIFILNSFVLFLILEIFFSLANNFILNKKIKLDYDFLFEKSPKVSLKEMNVWEKVKSVSILKFVGVGVNATDSLIISSFLSVSVNGIFSNYALIFTYAFNYIGTFFNGILASLGDLISENNISNIRLYFNRLNYLSYLMAVFSTGTIYFSINLFISKWIGVEYQLEQLSVILLCTIHYLKVMRQINWFFTSTSGIFDGFVKVSIIELIINLILSILLIKYIGLNGVLIGTFFASLYSWYGQSISVHSYILKKEVSEYFKKQLFLAAKFTLIIYFVYLINSFMEMLFSNKNEYILIFISLLCLYILIYYLDIKKNKEFVFLLNKLNSIIRRKQNVQ